MTDLAARPTSPEGAGTTAPPPNSTLAPAAARRVSTPRRRASRYSVRGPAGHRWFAVCALLVLVASDYKYRVRDGYETFGGKPDSAVILEIGIYAGVAAYLFYSHPPRFRIRRMQMPVLASYAWVALMLLSLLQVKYLTVELVRAFETLVILSIAVALSRRGGRAEFHTFLHGFLALVAGSVVFGVVVPMPRFANQADRFTWLRMHPVISAEFVAIATVIAVGYLVMYRAERPGPHWPRWTYAAMGIVVAGGLYATKTRGSVIAAVIGVLVVMLFVTRGRRRIELLTLTLVGVVGFGLALSSQILSYIARGESTERLATLNSRTELWDLAWHYIRERPLFGYGTGASRTLFLDSTGLGGAHNALVNILTDLGIVGTLAWLWVIGSTILTAVRSRGADPALRVERAVLLGLMATLIVNGVSTGGLGDRANVASTMLFLLAAWSSVLRRASTDLRADVPVRATTAG